MKAYTYGSLSTVACLRAVCNTAASARHDNDTNLRERAELRSRQKVSTVSLYRCEHMSSSGSDVSRYFERAQDCCPHSYSLWRLLDLCVPASARHLRASRWHHASAEPCNRSTAVVGQGSSCYVFVLAAAGTGVYPFQHLSGGCLCLCAETLGALCCIVAPATSYSR